MVAETLAPGWSDKRGVVPWNMRGFFQPSGEHSTEVVPPLHIGQREHGISKRFVCGSQSRSRRLYAGWEELRLPLAELYR
jgi:hypothetical protein